MSDAEEPISGRNALVWGWSCAVFAASGAYYWANGILQSPGGYDNLGTFSNYYLLIFCGVLLAAALTCSVSLIAAKQMSAGLWLMLGAVSLSLFGVSFPFVRQLADTLLGPG